MVTNIIRGGGGAGGLSGATPRDYNSASGGVPGVTSPIDTITGNLGGIGSIINSITGQQFGALRDQYPDEYFSTLGTLLGNTGRRAKGDISDLLPELQQNSAEDAVAGGVSGSGAENSKLLRDLGLTRYGVENQALKDLGTIQSEIPLVHPFDPTGIINGQLQAQERADLYAAAPSPEAAYRRAMAAAGGGGGGRGTPGLTYNPGGGGGKPVGTVDAALQGWANQAPQRGTAYNPGGSSQSFAPWGTFPNAASSGGGGYGEQDNFDPNWDTNPVGGDFGGSQNYGGGEGYDYWNSPQNQQNRENYSDLDPWLASVLDVGGGVDMTGGGYYGGGEDLGMSDYYDDEY
jgi:hypothetical protein